MKHRALVIKCRVVLETNKGMFVRHMALSEVAIVMSTETWKEGL